MCLLVNGIIFEMGKEMDSGHQISLRHKQIIKSLNILDQVNISNNLTDDQENEIKSCVSVKFHYKYQDNSQVHVGKHEKTELF